MAWEADTSASAALSYGNTAFEVSEGDGGNKKEMLKNVLMEMSLDGMVNERYTTLPY